MLRLDIKAEVKLLSQIGLGQLMEVTQKVEIETDPENYASGYKPKSIDGEETIRVSNTNSDGR